MARLQSRKVHSRNLEDKGGLTAFVLRIQRLDQRKDLSKIENLFIFLKFNYLDGNTEFCTRHHEQY